MAVASAAAEELPTTTSPSRRWQPILRGGDVARVRSLVEETVAAVHDAPATEPGLAYGAAGRALLFAYAARAGLRAPEAAVELVEPAELDLYRGSLGIAWAAAHLGEDVSPAHDQALLDQVARAPWQASTDLVSGLAGMGVYALQRLPRPAARRALEEIVARLDETKHAAGPGLAWLTSPDRLDAEMIARHPRGLFNAGMAHGVPGVVAFLAAALPHVPRAAALLDGAVAWLLSLAARRADGSWFPSAVAVDAPDEGEGSRAGWCYGDPGAIAALLQAARARGRADWEEAAIELARQLMKRPAEECGIVDAGLCHGTAGLAHILNRLHQATGEVAFRDAAIDWISHTLDLHEPGEGVGGWLAFSGAGAYEPDASLLVGAAGVGLALLAAASDVEPAWDACLYLRLTS